MVPTKETVSGKSIRPKQNGGLWKKILEHKVLYIFLLPTIIYLAIFAYIPMYGIQIAFKNFNPVLGIWKSPWIGFKHIIDFINSYNFWTIIRNTLTISLYSTLVGFPVPILLALVLNEIGNKKYKKFIQTTLYAPHFISMVVMSGIILIMLSPSIGVINRLLDLMGFESQYFIINPKAFKHIYVWSGIWQNMGWSAIIYLAALSNVDPELHEAATVDGASRLQRVYHINIPTIKPTIAILLIMSIGSLVSVGFEKIYLLQNPLNLESSEVVSTYVYKRGLLDASYSFAAAVGFFNNIVNVILLILANYTVRKVSDTSLF